MLLAAPVPVEIVNPSSGGVSAAEWVAAVLPGVVAVLVVFLGAWFNRRQQEAQWRRQVDQEDKRWAETQQAEREKWQRQELRVAYAGVIRAYMEYVLAVDELLSESQRTDDDIERVTQLFLAFGYAHSETAIICSPAFLAVLDEAAATGHKFSKAGPKSAAAEQAFREASAIGDRLMAVARDELAVP